MCAGARLLVRATPESLKLSTASIGIPQGYSLFSVVPYVLTLGNLVISCRPDKVTQESPGELVSTR